MSEPQKLSSRVFALIAAMLLVLTGVVSVQQASAQETPEGITFGTPSFEWRGTTAQPDVWLNTDGEYAQWSGVNVTIPWSSEAPIAADTTFSVEFPAPLTFTPSNYDLTTTDGTKIGECLNDTVPATWENTNLPAGTAVPSTQAVTSCTFTTATGDKTTGELVIRMQARLPSESSILDFVIDGTPVKVDLGKRIGKPAPRPLPESPEKQVATSGENFKNGIFTWKFVFMGDTFAGVEGDVVFTDTLSGDHEFIGDGPTGTSFDANLWRDYDTQTSRQALTIEHNYDNTNYPRTATFTIATPEGGWDANRVYEIEYQTQAIDGNLLDMPLGTSFTNNISSDLLADDVTKTYTTFSTGEGTVAWTDRGSFEITKDVAEDSAPIPADMVFTVTAEYDVTESANPNFDTSELPTQILIRLGQTVVGTGNIALPAGTIVTLSEVAVEPTETLEFVRGIFFQETEPGVFTEAGDTVTITILENSNVALILENSAAEKPAPTSTPEEPTPTTSSEEPTPTTSSEEPAPTTSSEEPAPTTSSEEPAPTTSPQMPFSTDEPTTSPEPTPAQDASSNPSSNPLLERCWANASKSPLLWLIPVGVLGYGAAKAFEPYAQGLNAPAAQIGSDLQRQLGIQDQIDNLSRQFGQNGVTVDNPFQAQMIEINKLAGQLNMGFTNPSFNTIAKNFEGIATAAAIVAGVLGSIALISYWCTTDPAENGSSTSSVGSVSDS